MSNLLNRTTATDFVASLLSKQILYIFKKTALFLDTSGVMKSSPSMGFGFQAGSCSFTTHATPLQLDYHSHFSKLNDEV
jgi:hypothetical protein